MLGEAPGQAAQLPAQLGAAPARGGYARGEVDIAALRSGPQLPGMASLELALAQPFGALFSALLPGRAFRIQKLELDYVNVERLGTRATYSAQLAAVSEGTVELRLLVAHGAWLCVCGRAQLELEQATAGAAPGKLEALSGQNQRGSSHG